MTHIRQECHLKLIRLLSLLLGMVENLDLAALEHHHNDAHNRKGCHRDDSEDYRHVILLPKSLGFVEKDSSLRAILLSESASFQTLIIDDRHLNVYSPEWNLRHISARDQVGKTLLKILAKLLRGGEDTPGDAIAEISLAKAKNGMTHTLDEMCVSGNQLWISVYCHSLIKPCREQKSDIIVFAEEILLKLLARLVAGKKPLIFNALVVGLHIVANLMVEVAVDIEGISHKDEFLHIGKHISHQVDSLLVEIRDMDY